jgi:hypothetical protein
LRDFAKKSETGCPEIEINRRNPQKISEAKESINEIYGKYLNLPCMTFDRALLAIKEIKDPYLSADLNLKLVQHFRASSP